MPSEDTITPIFMSRSYFSDVGDSFEPLQVAQRGSNSLLDNSVFRWPKVVMHYYKVALTLGCIQCRKIAYR